MQIQLVLGSGGVYCYTYVGAIQEMQERGFKFSSVSGVSAGALLGLLLAAGLSGQEIKDRLLAFDVSKLPKRKPWLRDLWRLIPPYCIYSQSIPKEILLSLLGGNDPRLSDLPVPFASVGLDIRTGRLFIYSSRSEPHMTASEVIAIATALPGLFPACESGGRTLIDGAMASECPVWLAGAHGRPDPVVALKTQVSASWSRPTNFKDFLTRAVRAGITGGDAALADVFGNSAEITISVDKAEEEDNFAISVERRHLLIDEGRRQMRDRLERGGLDFSPAEAGSDTSPESADAARRFMALTSPKDTVFISYSRDDTGVRSELVAALEQELVRIPFLRLWVDTQIQPGEQWESEIVRAMHRTRVAVLLVSKAFLKSSFIRGEEEPFFVKAAKANVLTVLWVNLDLDEESLQTVSKDLASFQALNQARALCHEKPQARQAVWRELAQCIQKTFPNS